MIDTQPGSERPTARRARRGTRVGRAGRREGTDLDPRLEGYHRELRRHCQRMLGSGSEAEDAVQETMVRAWRALDRFDGRSSTRTWLYRIATNVCLDMLRGPQRRARPMDLGPTSTGVESRPGVAFVGGTRTEPVDDGRGAPVTADPAELVASRDAVRRAFVVALRTLPPQQRAVLILRDVLRWHTTEIAELLGTTETAVNSALQRARATLTAHADASLAAATYDPGDDTQRRLLDGYVRAFECFDVQSLVSLLRFDHLTRRRPSAATAA